MKRQRTRCDHCGKLADDNGNFLDRKTGENYCIGGLSADSVPGVIGEYSICERCTNKHDDSYWINWSARKTQTPALEQYNAIVDARRIVYQAYLIRPNFQHAIDQLARIGKYLTVECNEIGQHLPPWQPDGPSIIIYDVTERITNA